jgi:hypothetical protein
MQKNESELACMDCFSDLRPSHLHMIVVVSRPPPIARWIEAHRALLYALNELREATRLADDIPTLDEFGNEVPGRFTLATEQAERAKDTFLTVDRLFTEEYAKPKNKWTSSLHNLSDTAVQFHNAAHVRPCAFCNAACFKRWWSRPTIKNLVLATLPHRDEPLLVEIVEHERGKFARVVERELLAHVRAADIWWQHPELSAVEAARVPFIGEVR